MQAALEHRLPKPLRYFRVLLARFAFNGNRGNEKLSSVYHNPSCDGVCCTRDAEEKRT